MGLKTTNYEVKELGITLPQAYAVIAELKVNRTTNYGRAIFHIQASRETALDKKPLAVEKVDFPVNMAENPSITAYKTATKQLTLKNEKGEVYQTVTMPFFGWDNDIVQ